MKIKIMKLDERAVVPSAGTGHSAGYDLCACMKEERTVIAPHSAKLIGTGLAAAIPEGYFGGIFARSGLSLKQGLRPANCVGVIDPDYRGEICVSLHNDSGTERIIEQGERIAQLLILPCMKAEFEECGSLDRTDRGEGGFGHTGLY